MAARDPGPYVVTELRHAEVLKPGFALVIGMERSGEPLSAFEGIYLRSQAGLRPLAGSTPDVHVETIQGCYCRAIMSPFLQRENVPIMPSWWPRLAAAGPVRTRRGRSLRSEAASVSWE
jgi:hypothetical protein